MRVAALCLLAGLLVALEGVAADSISAQKCAEYAQHVKQCAADYDAAPFVGKSPAKHGEFPHMARIGYEGGQLLCGGSLIAPDYVLTSAVCARSAKLPTFVLLGEEASSPQNISVSATIVHPDYQRAMVYDDVALLRLEKAATISDLVRPACLHRGPALEAGALPVATGWGKISFEDDEPSDKLMKVAVPVVAHAACEQKYDAFSKRSLPRGIQDEKQICAGSPQSDTCQGDSGGPLQVLASAPHCMYQVVGITSFGVLCNSHIPSVYTRVSAYAPWIESVVWP